MREPHVILQITDINKLFSTLFTHKYRGDSILDRGREVSLRIISELGEVVGIGLGGLVAKEF